MHVYLILDIYIYIYMCFLYRNSTHIYIYISSLHSIHLHTSTYACLLSCTCSPQHFLGCFAAVEVPLTCENFVQLCGLARRAQGARVEEAGRVPAYCFNCSFVLRLGGCLFLVVHFLVSFFWATWSLIVSFLRWVVQRDTVGEPAQATTLKASFSAATHRHDGQRLWQT